MTCPKVSVIIPLHTASQRFRDDLRHFLSLDYPDYEILVVSDSGIDLDNARLEVVLTGQELTGPAEKRDIAISRSQADVCAFIDDDAYPRPDWLKKAVAHFRDPMVAAVGGPGLTPEDDPFMARAGGAVYSSVLGSGKYVYRFSSRAMREVDDYPAFNLLVRRSVLKEVGGFGSTFYGGEDTKLCLAIVNTGKKILYDPEVVVYHHRRTLFRAHLRQVSNVAVHRGFFVKAFPQTSLRPFYFLPTAFSLVLILGAVLSFFSQRVAIAYVSGLSVWLAACLLSMRNKNPLLSAVASVGILATHLTYGLAFIKGLASRGLTR